MEFFGTFLKGAITGIVGLGVVSWAYCTFLDDSSNTGADDQEEE